MREVAQATKLPLLEWSVTEGLVTTPPEGIQTLVKPAKIAEAIRHIRETAYPALYLFKDLGPHCKDPAVVRSLRDLYFSPDSRLWTVFLADATALPVLDALAMGTPIVGSAVGAVPEAVGSAGLLVPPRDPDRLAAALRAAWAEDRVHRAIAAAAAERAAPGRRTWADVARGTREAYAAAVTGRS